MWMQRATDALGGNVMSWSGVRTLEQRSRIAVATREAMAVPEVRIKLSEAFRGKVPWNKGVKTGIVPRSAFKLGCVSLQKGRKYSLEHRIKLSLVHGGDGRFLKDYGSGFTKTVKRFIFVRDGFMCQICGSNHPLVCHHKDKTKVNHSFDNLQTLCDSCHKRLHVQDVKRGFIHA